MKKIIYTLTLLFSINVAYSQCRVEYSKSGEHPMGTTARENIHKNSDLHNGLEAVWFNARCILSSPAEVILFIGTSHSGSKFIPIARRLNINLSDGSVIQLNASTYDERINGNLETYLFTYKLIKDEIFKLTQLSITKLSLTDTRTGSEYTVPNVYSKIIQEHLNCLLNPED